jgi:hypothetical protein
VSPRPRGQERSAATAGGPPPGLVETRESLGAKARNARASSATRGGKPGPKTDADPGAPARGPGRPTAASLITEFPVEALAEAHYQVWTLIGKALRSRYKITKPAADEMAKYADLVLRQYLGPALGDNAPLALWGLTQITAISACFALREPAAPAPMPAPLPAGRPASTQVSTPAAPYERGPLESELRHIPPS